MTAGRKDVCRNGWPRGRLLCEDVSIDRGRGRAGKDAKYRIEREPRRHENEELSLDSRIIEAIRAIGDVAPDELRDVVCWHALSREDDGERTSRQLGASPCAFAPDEQSSADHGE